MKIGIIGAGSLGLLIGAYLSKKHDVTLYIRRKEQRKLIEKHGVELWNQSVYTESLRIDVIDVQQMKEDEWTIVCVKQPEVKQVIDQLVRKKGDGSFVFLQNGMGHIKYLHAFKNPVIVGVVEHGAQKLSDYQVNHLGEGTIKLAPFSHVNDLPSFIQNVHTEQFPFEYAESWQQLLHRKLLGNAVINPITALFNVPNGAILTNNYLNNIAKQLAEEAANVLGFDHVEAWTYVEEIARNTANNTSSMRADINSGRKTEIDAITGYIIEQANTESTFYHRFIYDAIRGLEYERTRS